jgi:hypothetical protein
MEIGKYVNYQTVSGIIIFNKETKSIFHTGYDTYSIIQDTKFYVVYNKHLLKRTCNTLEEAAHYLGV